MALIEAIAELIDIPLQVPSAYDAELAEHAALQGTPRAFDAVGVNVAIHVPHCMLDDGVREDLAHAKITRVFVGH